MTTTHLVGIHPPVADDTEEVEEVEEVDAVRAHRPDVVRRLLARGLSPAALDQILPGWADLTDE